MDAESYEKIEAFSPKNDTKLKLTRSEDKVEILITGSSAHGSTPYKGQSAIAAIVDLLADLRLGDSEIKNFLTAIKSKIGYEFYGESLGISERILCLVN